MRTYFKIKEKINCGSCNGVNDVSLIACGYCGSNFHAIEPSAGVLAIRDKIDKHFMNAEFEDAKEVITELKEITGPILQFRALAVEFNDLLTESEEMDAAKVRKHLDKLGNLLTYSEDYFNAYAGYVHGLLPFTETLLTAEAYRNIVDHGIVLQYDDKGLLTEAFKLQLAAATLTEEQVKEIKFYLDPDNQIDDPAFAKKKKYLIDIYNQATQNL